MTMIPPPSDSRPPSVQERLTQQRAEQRAAQRERQIAKLSVTARRRQKRQFAALGAIGALVLAVLLECGFALTNVGGYFYDNAANVVMFHPAVERSTRDHLGTGDVQLTLYWKGRNDLDLHCVDPYGQRVSFNNRQVASGGRLDFDMNAEGPPWSQDSVENIFWPYGAAPVGDYKIYIHHWRRHGGAVSVPYQLRIIHQGSIEWQQGVATYQFTPGVPFERDIPNAVNPLQVTQSFPLRIDTPPTTWLGQRPVQWVAIAVAALWLALIGGGITAALLDGLNRWYDVHRRSQLVTATEARRLMGRVALWGAAYGALTQLVFGLIGAGAPFFLEVWRFVAWTTLAVCIGGRCGRFIPEHLPVGFARRGGLWGGFVGGWAFAVMTLGKADSPFAGADLAGRIVTAMLIGACIGWQIQLPVSIGLGDPEEEIKEEEVKVATEVAPPTSETVFPFDLKTDNSPSLTPFDFPRLVPSHHEAPHLTLPEPTREEQEVPHFVPVHTSEQTELLAEAESSLVLPVPEVAQDEVRPIVKQVAPREILVPAPREWRVMRSRNGRQAGGRAMGGPRHSTGGRHVRIGQDKPPDNDA